MLFNRTGFGFGITLIIALFWLGRSAAAAPPFQNHPQQVDNFSYTVQPGDTLVGIALRYNLNLAELILTNNLANPNLIFPGQELVLPGLPAAVTSTEMPAGQFHTVQPGETLFQIANQYGLTVGAIVLANNLVNPDLVQIGHTLRIPNGPPPAPASLPAPFATLELSEPVIIQGRTLVVKVSLSDPAASLSGSFEGQPTLFWPGQAGGWWTIIPIHALAEPNSYPLLLTAVLADGQTVTTFTNVEVIAGPYGRENINLDEQRGQLLDAELIRQEQEKLKALWSVVSLRPRWEGPFRYPVDASSLRITSYFGARRSYNGSEEISFHGGVDFGGQVGLPVYTAAAGRVVLAENLTIRGQAVLIDHGAGLFSGYWHMSQLAVGEGQEVPAGAVAGYLGGTGLVTGPHLHWEMRLNGIAVEPLQWVQQTIP